MSEELHPWMEPEDQPRQEHDGTGHLPAGTGADQVRLADPAQMVAWIPYQLGFWPHESVVIVALHDEPDHSRQVGLVARMDLSVLGSAEAGAAARQEMSTHLRREAASAALLMVYRHGCAPGALTQDRLVAPVLQWWEQTPWSRREATFLITDDHFRCLECGVEPCCPREGRPLAVLDSTAVSAQQVYSGHSYAPSREALVPEQSAGRQRCSQARAAAARQWDRRPGHGDPHLLGWQSAMISRWEESMARGAPRNPSEGQNLEGPQRGSNEGSATDMGTLLAGLWDPWVRDAILIASAGAVADPAQTARRVLTGDQEDALAVFFTGTEPPDSARVLAADRLLARLAAHATGSWGAPVCAMRAWLAWWRADGARANILVDRALQIDPEHHLAQLLSVALTHGIPPQWVRAARPGPSETAA